MTNPFAIKGGPMIPCPQTYILQVSQNEEIILDKKDTDKTQPHVRCKAAEFNDNSGTLTVTVYSLSV